MPLRDHFRPPLDDVTSWDGFHAGWPMVIVQTLAPKLPRRYVAAPGIHSGSFLEIDVATFETEDQTPMDSASGDGTGGGVATAIWAPPKPTLTLVTDLPQLDEFEVRVYDNKRGRQLVAAIEIVSPSNKDRPEHRRAFVAKCAALLQKLVSVTIIDLVTTRQFNLYGELLELIGQTDPFLHPEPPPLYIVSCRGTKKDGKWLLENWTHALQLGQALPTLPLWLADNFSIPLELESSYEATCQVLRIP